MAPRTPLETIAYYHKESAAAGLEGKRQIELSIMYRDLANNLLLELEFEPLPEGTDWYRTVPIGKLSRIMEKHGFIWCPRCRGAGVLNWQSAFRRNTLCPRCGGRTIVAARTVTDSEMERMSPNTQKTVMSWWQYPKVRSDLGVK